MKYSSKLKKILIPLVCVVIAVVCGLVFTGDWDAFLGGNSGSPVTSSDYSQYESSDISGSTELPVTTPQTTTTLPTTTSAATTKATAETAAKPPETTTAATTTAEPSEVEIEYYFRSEAQYVQHYEKHGHEFTPIFGEITIEEYLLHANELIRSNDGEILTKYEEDGDFMYFRPSTEEFLVLSPDGYIRTYFIPTAGIDYWNRQ